MPCAHRNAFSRGQPITRDPGPVFFRPVCAAVCVDSSQQFPSQPVLPTSSFSTPGICYRRSVAMCADAKPGQATAEASRPMYFLALSRSGAARRASLVLSHAEDHPADKPHTAAAPRILGWRSFSSAIRTRATARYLPCRFTRAKPSLFALTGHDSQVTSHVGRGGTVNRPRTHVTHRKQTTGHHQGRNFPVHFLFSIFGQNPMALALRRFGGRNFDSGIRTRAIGRSRSRCIIRAKLSPFASTNHHSPIITHGFLPGFPKRTAFWGGYPERPDAYFRAHSALASSSDAAEIFLRPQAAGLL